MAGDALEPRLIRFYLACVEEEQAALVTFPLSGAGDRFALVEDGPEPLLTGTGTWAPNGPDPTVRWLERRLTAGATEQVYAGYPLVVGADPRTSDHSLRVSPLFTVPASVHRRRGGRVEVRTERLGCELNPYALELGGLDRAERPGLIDAVGARAELDGLVEPSAVISTWLQLLREEGLFTEDPDPDPRELGPVTQRCGLVNAAMLYVAERGPVIWHLARDLEDLADRPAEELRHGPLGVLLGAGAPEPLRPAEPQPAVVPSNLAQDEAITNALDATLTVVTGPPGTGKSQVLVNTVAAALARDETVLFASRNNQAVDVVFQRLADTSPRAVPIRAGNTSRRAELATTILAALGRSHPPARRGRAREAWVHTAAGLHDIYEQAAARRRLEAEVTAADAALDEALAQAPPDCLQLDDPDPVAEELVRIETLLPVRSARRPIWPPARRRWRRACDELAERWSALRDRHPVLALGDEPDPEALRHATALTEAARRVAQARHRHQTAQAALAGLPEPWELDERYVAKMPERLEVGRRLLEASWDTCLARAAGDDTDTTRAARRYADGMARRAAGEGGAVARLLDLVPDVLRGFPVWGVTNLSARGSLPLTSGLFDLVVIDEASQCDVASALPLLYRARRALIIGDPNQLIHITSLSERKERAVAQRHGLTDTQRDTFSYRQRSLYSLAADRLASPPVFLDRHYRSRLGIIAFSNDHFYGSRLEVLTPDDDRMGPAVQWVHVPGVFRRGAGGRSAQNPAEVAAVVDEIDRLRDELGLVGGDIGVVTPFRAQVEAIRDRLAGQPRDTDGLVVATAHRFQGDERDVIVFSPVVCDGMPEHLARFAADPNLVNVAVTRARRRLVVVGDRDACLASVGVLRDLARYIADLEAGAFASPLERALHDALVAAGIPARPGVEVAGHRLDLAVEVGDLRLDVECDGAAYHRDRRADATRDERVRAAGWEVLRFPGRRIHADPAGCAAEVQARIAAHHAAGHRPAERAVSAGGGAQRDR